MEGRSVALWTGLALFTLASLSPWSTRPARAQQPRPATERSAEQPSEPSQPPGGGANAQPPRPPAPPPTTAPEARPALPTKTLPAKVPAAAAPAAAPTPPQEGAGEGGDADETAELTGEADADADPAPGDADGVDAVPPGAAPTAPPAPTDAPIPPAPNVNPFAPIAAPEPPAVRQGDPPEAFAALWAKRREALGRGDQAAADAALAELVDRFDIAGWPNASVYAISLSRESHASAAAGDSQSAVELADAAMAIAPDRPEPYVARARVRLQLVQLWPAAEDTARAALRVLLDPIEARLRLGNATVAAIVAFLLAALVFALISVYRHFRTLTFDVHHALPRWTARVHATILTAAVMLAPIVAPIGWLWSLIAWIALPSRYYERRERIAGIAVLCFVAAMPLFLPRAVTYLGYPGSRAQDIYLAATDMGAVASAARVMAEPVHTPSELLALGLRDRWSGQLESAITWLTRAADAGLEDASLQTHIGNIRFQLDDKQGAIDAYEVALRIDPQHVPALFNLSRAYFSLAEHQKAGDAHRRATAVDYARVEVFTQKAKLRGPLYVASEPVPRRLLAVHNGRTPALQAAAQDLWEAMAGDSSAQHTMLGAGAAALLVLLSGLGRRRQRLPPAGADVAAAEAAPLVKGTIAPLQRIRQEIEVHRHQVRLMRVRRVVAIFVAGAGQLVVGRSVEGLVLLSAFLTSLLLLMVTVGVVPSPVPLAGGPSFVAAILYAAVAALSYAASLWDSHREDR